MTIDFSDAINVYLICREKETYSLCGGLWCQAVFAYGQFESVFNLSLQLWARDPQHRAAGAQAEVQGGAVLWTLKREFAAIFYLCCLSVKLYKILFHTVSNSFQQTHLHL